MKAKDLVFAIFGVDCFLLATAFFIMEANKPVPEICKQSNTVCNPWSLAFMLGFMFSAIGVCCLIHHYFRFMEVRNGQKSS